VNSGIRVCGSVIPIRLPPSRRQSLHHYVLHPECITLDEGCASRLADRVGRKRIGDRADVSAIGAQDVDRTMDAEVVRHACYPNAALRIGTHARAYQRDPVGRLPSAVMACVDADSSSFSIWTESTVTPAGYSGFNVDWIDGGPRHTPGSLGAGKCQRYFAPSNRNIVRTSAHTNRVPQLADLRATGLNTR
jgi:hypothetical protein